MQSSLCTPTNIHPFNLPWALTKTTSTREFVCHKPFSKKFNSCAWRTPLTLTNSLRTSINFQPEEGLVEGEGPGPSPRPGSTKLLPVVIRQSGRVSRYIWDGNGLELVSVDGGASSLFWSLDFEDGFRKFLRVSSLAVRNFFIPKRVPDNYMEYVKWKFLHRVSSSALQVLATQAMFRAIGIGYSRSLPSAAALNWVLKDGLGRLSRCIYTASLASAFDTNLKRVRFSTSVLFSLSIGVELLTPVFPQYFLLLATLANIAKQISLACYLATSSAIHRSFAVADNLGEFSAKAQIQSVCFDNLGLILAAILNMWLKNDQRLLAGLPFVFYPIFSAVDLFGIYQGLKNVHLQTITKDRLEIILNSWIESGHMPSPADVSKEEGIDFWWSKSKELWPIRIGCLHTKDQMPMLSMMTMQSLSGEDFHFICMESCRELRTNRQGILLCLREGASTADVIKGLLQACYIRKALLSSSRWDSLVKSRDPSDGILQEWFKLVENGMQYAEKDICQLKDRMSTMGWTAKNILLSTEEQSRYSFVDD